MTQGNLQPHSTVRTQWRTCFCSVARVKGQRWNFIYFVIKAIDVLHWFSVFIFLLLGRRRGGGGIYILNFCMLTLSICFSLGWGHLYPLNFCMLTLSFFFFGGGGGGAFMGPGQKPHAFQTKFSHSKK